MNHEEDRSEEEKATAEQQRGEICRRLDQVLADGVETRKSLEDIGNRQKATDARARRFHSEVRKHFDELRQKGALSPDPTKKAEADRRNTNNPWGKAG